MTSLCSSCKKTLPASSFFKNKARKNGLNCYCKTCYDSVRKRYPRDNNKECEHRRRRMYGVTSEQFESMTSGGCALCGEKDPPGKNKWNIDHCHETGKTRGVLCHRCNISLGHYEVLTRLVGVKKIQEYILKSYDL